MAEINLNLHYFADSCRDFVGGQLHMDDGEIQIGEDKKSNLQPSGL